MVIEAPGSLSHGVFCNVYRPTSLPCLTYGATASGVTSADVLESHKGLTDEILAGAYDASCRATAPRQLLVLHPGNPGVVHFYDDFIVEMSRRAPRMAVIVLGYCGHTTDSRCGTAVFDLQDQVDAASAFWERIASTAASQFPEGIFVAGHSIGSHVALHMAARFECIQKAFLLTPTIINMEVSPNGRRNRSKLNKAFITFASTVLAPTLGWLPNAVKRFVVRTVEPSMHARHHSLVMSMPKPSLVRNILSLAKTEFAQIRDLDVPLLEAVGPRLHLYFVHEDGWVPFADLGRMRAAVPGLSIEIEHDREVKHAWCCCASHQVAAAVARVTSTFVKA